MCLGTSSSLFFMQIFVPIFGTTLRTQKPSIIPLQLSAIAEIELRFEDTAKDEATVFFSEFYTQPLYWAFYNPYSPFFACASNCL